MISFNILFQGRHLQRGSRLEDFNITVGYAACIPESLNDTQLECRPPTNISIRNINDWLCQNDTLSINVCIHPIYYETVFSY